MATVTVTAHHNSSWEQKNGKWVKTKKAPTTHKVEVNDFGGPLYGEGIHRAFKKQHPEAAKTAERLEYKKDLKESRKISSDIGKAFLNKTAKKSKNSHTDGKSLYLHGHEIAKHGENGSVHGTMAGWPTKTTKDRLNAISNDRFHTKKGKHYYGDKEIGEHDWVQIKESIRSLVEGAIKDLETKDEEEKRLLKTNKPKKIMTDKERSQFKDLQKKDLKEGLFSGNKSLKPTKTGIKRALQKDAEENSGPSGDDYQPTKKGTKLIKRLTNEGAMLKALGNRVKENLRYDARDAKEAILKAGPKIGAAAEKGLVGLGKAGEKVVKKTIYPTMYKHLQRVNEDEETASRYKKALADSKGSITKDGEELVKNRIKQLQKEGFTRTLDKVSGNQKRRIKKKLKHQNSMVSTPLSKIYTNNKRLQRLGN